MFLNCPFLSDPSGRLRRKRRRKSFAESACDSRLLSPSQLLNTMIPSLLVRSLIAGLMVPLMGCAAKNYGDEQFRLGMATHGKDVMWVPSQTDIVHRMLETANVTAADIVYDLGSGDGVIPIEAAKKYGVRSVGIEYNPDLVALAKRNAKRADVEHLVSFRQGDIFVEDFSKATVVTLFLGENLNAKLMPKLLSMRPGTRIVSNTFRIESWTPDQEIRTPAGGIAYFWVVPAPIEGRWELSGIPNATRVTLEIRQKKQFFDATIFYDQKRVAHIENAVLKGDRLTLEFMHVNQRQVLQGQVSGAQFTGQLNAAARSSVTGRLIPPR
jgi:precorrin-6B methylase 2